MSALERVSGGRRASPVLQRHTFKTSRLGEFCGTKELTAQFGHGPGRWPIIILKELADNSLDICEECQIPPAISVEVFTKTGQIIVTDNGPGLPAETIAGVLDYTVRVSSREAYTSPSRGQQGNALKCIFAAAFALDGTRGTTIVEARGQAHRIVFEMDPVRREPRILREIGASDVKSGTCITLFWPQNACDLLVAAEDRFLQTCCTFTTFNPHLSLRGRWNDDEFVNVPATNPGWSKWRGDHPTSSHWYNPDSFERYIGALIADDEDHGRAGRTVRHFIAELDGLSGTAKQKLVLAETETSGVTLAKFFEGGKSAVARLLYACQANTKPISPERLGVIGADHLRGDLGKLGGDEESFEYRKHLGVTRAGLPFAIEVAFEYCPAEECRQQIVAGVNFSAGIGSPFERLSQWQGLTGLLGSQHAGWDEPVVVAVHYTCPDVQFLDRGKGILDLPPEVSREIIRLVEAVTKSWDRQKRAEIRHDAAAANRRQRLLKERNKPEKQPPPEPTGILAERITAAAAEAGTSVDNLVVLSPTNDPYTAWRRQREAEWFAELFARLVASVGKKHLRGLFYLVVSTPGVATPKGKQFVNDYNCWLLLQKASKAARWLGLVPFDRIIDERNAEPEIYVPGEAAISIGVSSVGQSEIPGSAEAAMPESYLHGFVGRQTHRIIFFGEKASLAVVLRPIAEAIGAEMVLVTGESSDTRLYQALDRASADGRPAVILYFADFDPSGHQMSISVARKAQAFRDLRYPELDIKVYRVALTVEQVRELGLPSSPFKATEKRAEHWRETFGHEQTEIDAMVELHPEALRQAVFDAIAPFYDRALDGRVQEAADEWRREAEKALAEHPTHGNLKRRVASAWKRVRTAARELERVQHEAAGVLGDTLPDPPEVPKAEPKGKAKPALFDTEADFITASLRLKADKKLSGSDDDEGDAT